MYETKTVKMYVIFFRNLQDIENGESAIIPQDVNGLLTALQDVDLSEVLQLPRSQPCDEQSLPCDHTTIFRSVTGWCNNLRTPGRGKSLRAFSRLLPPVVRKSMIYINSSKEYVNLEMSIVGA